jgi:hypothetical protein
MKSTRILLTLIIICFLILFGYFVYSSFMNGSKVPPEVKESADYPIAVAEALRLRYSELMVASFLFPFTIWGLALARLPALSWLRTILGSSMTLLCVFAVFSKLMEDRFREKFAGASLPLEAVQVAFVFCLEGVLFSALVFFATERIHAWRLGR